MTISFRSADFARIFDRDPSNAYYAQLQKKAESLFMSDGVSIDFGSGMHRYVAFERSASMSRNAVLSFIREDFYDKVTERIRLGMDISECQLSKLYAYNGLMLSGGTRIDGIDIDRPHRVIVVDNPHFTAYDTKVITVEDDGSGNSVRKYHRVERRENIDILGYDGEGIISKEYAALINKQLDGRHTSFQIRLPYIKGMLHQVDIHDFFKSAGVAALTDIWGVEHKIADVDIILTKSMFKGYGWLTENHMSWTDYWSAFRRYSHALYISGVSKDTPQQFTELNYQFLNTLSITADEFRPLDLPLCYPATDTRHWLTKETEREYHRLCCDGEYRIRYFTGRKYRILIDLIADIDDENTITDRKRLIRDSDSADFCQLMEAYLHKPVNVYFRDAVADECRRLIDKIIKPDEAIKYLAAMGKRKALFDLLPDRIEKHVRRQK